MAAPSSTTSFTAASLTWTNSASPKRALGSPFFKAATTANRLPPRMSATTATLSARSLWLGRAIHSLRSLASEASCTSSLLRRERPLSGKRSCTRRASSSAVLTSLSGSRRDSSVMARGG